MTRSKHQFNQDLGGLFKFFKTCFRLPQISFTIKRFDSISICLKVNSIYKVTFHIPTMHQIHPTQIHLQSVYLIGEEVNLPRSIIRIIENRYNIIGRSAGLEEGFSNIKSHFIKADLVIVKVDSIELVNQYLCDFNYLRKELPNIYTVILTTNIVTNHSLFHSIYADGFLPTNALEEDILSCLSYLHEGFRYVSPKLFNFETVTDKLLTVQEKKVLHLIAKGNSNLQIANSLFISPHTVKNHKSNIVNKLNLGNTVELVKFACKFVGYT